MIRFFDLLAIDRTLSLPEQLAAAAAKWPNEEVQPFTGDAFGDTDAYLSLMDYLQDVLFFKSVYSGTSGGTVGISAELHIGAPAATVPLPLVVAKMPDIAFFLLPTHGVPAHISVTRNAEGQLDVVIQGLPVEIQLPPGFIRPQRKPGVAGGELADFTTTAAPFDANDPDSLQITLRDFDPSSIFVRVNVKMTPEFDFAIDTQMPISIGPCVFLDLPCEALHDFQLIPSPRLQHAGEIPVEWTRHYLDAVQLSSTITGMYTFRAIELDRKAEPVAEILKRISTTRPAPDPTDPEERNEIEPIIEDIAFPLFMSPLPIPLHFRLGLRRVIVDLEAPAGEEYALETAPVEIPIRSWRLKIFRFVIQTTTEPQALGEIEAVLVAGSDPPNNWAFGFDYNDDGVLIATAIIPVEHRKKLFRVLNREVRLIGVKVGYSLFEPDPRRVGESPGIVIPLGDVGWANRFIFLLDFEIKNAGEKNAFAFSDKGGPDQPTILHDLGWYLGGLSLGGFYDPDGLEIVALGKFRIEIQEIGVVSATNGASYLMLSAGIDFGIGKSRPSEPPPAQPGDPEPQPPLGSEESRQRGGGIHLYRLKFRMGDQDDEAADFLLDGLSLSVITDRVELEGFGMISDQFIGGTRLREFGFGLRARFELLKKKLDLGIQFFYGSASGAENFNYWLFSLFFGGPIPLGSTKLTKIRLLVAGNMRPRLAPPDGNPDPLRLFRWYKSDGDAITLPLNRKLTKWERRDDSFALGAGLQLNLAGTDFTRLDIFFFVHTSPETAGMFGAMECYMGKGSKPVAYGVLEIDFKRGSWAFEFGINMGLANVIGEADLPSTVTNAAALTGTFFISRNIDAVAVGQFADPATWLTLRVKWFTGWKAEIWFALCIHSVDAPEGPNVIAISAGAKGTLDFAVGALKLYATLIVVWQPWRNESHESGWMIRIEAGVRIRIFRFINFGASIEIELDWLDTKPRYSRQSFCFKISTPWWLPDVTIRFEHHSGGPNVTRMTVASTPLIAASALPAAITPPVNIGVTPLVGPVLDEKAVHSLERLRTTGPAVVAAGGFDALDPIATDSRVALDFKASLDAPMTIVPGTPAGVGTQTSGEVEVRYELVEIGIRRRKRFGAGAGVWTNLITPESTHIHSPDDVNTTFTSAVRFEWDVDVVRAGRTDTRRLLINADTAYSFSSSSAEGDDVASTTFPGWPCCVPPGRPTVVWHEVDFDEIPFGVRAPAFQRFTDSNGTLHWQGGPPPVVAPPATAPAGSFPAAVNVSKRPAGPIAVASFDERAAICEIFAFWKPPETSSVIVVEAFDGLKLLESQQFQFISAPPPVIRFKIPSGMTSLLIRKVGEIEPKDGIAELVRIRYRTTREVLDDALEQRHCEDAEDRVHGSGMLAWLPNRDYEVTVRVRVGLKHERSGAQDTTVEQKAFFRTKGLPGLNAVARVGDEIEPYVESRYPGPGSVRLYRREPLAVAFTERFNILVPVNRTTSTAEEANQILEWVLAVEKVGGGIGYERLSQTAADWVVAHRGVEPTPRPRHPVVLDAVVFHTGERQASSIDPLIVRYEAMIDRPGGCANPGDGLHPSQVLLHEPYDPGAPEDETPRWEADQELRVNLRQKNAPFVDRAEFEAPDATAFTKSAASGSPAVWRSDEGAMRVFADPQPAAAQYAVFGESDWRHVQIETVVDPAGAEAGVAMAVAGTQSVEALLSSTGNLRIIERNGATIRSLAAPINVGTPGAVTLEVTVYDDRIRAKVGEQSIEGALGTIREGRLALVSRGGGRFMRLLVTGLDAWRFHAHTSRYDDFHAHIESFDGVLGVLNPGDFGTPTSNVAGLLAQTGAQIPQVMTERSDVEARQRLFEKWTTTLGLPLREDPRILSLTRWVEGGTTSLLVLESDEPMPFSSDVTLALSKKTHADSWPPPMPDLPAEVQEFLAQLEFDGEEFTAPALPKELHTARRILRATVSRGVVRVAAFEIERGPNGIIAKPRKGAFAWPGELDPPHSGYFVLVDEQGHPLAPPLPSPTPIVWSPVETRILTNGDETCALIVPNVPLGAGTYRLVFEIDRRRWRAGTPDATSNYRAEVTLQLTWS